MLALVTGGAGFIGSHLVDRLLEEGLKVRVLDNFSTGHRSNLPAHPALEVIAGDVANCGLVNEVMRDMTWVFHEAAVASVPQTISDPLGSQRTNYLGTLNLLEAARKTGVKRFMFAASAAAYGDLPEMPKRETMPVKPLSPYAVDKLASEYACQVYHRLYGLETVCLRYFNVFGSRQYPASPCSDAISIFSDCLTQGKQPTIYGDGEQTRDFVNIADVVEANIQAAKMPEAAGEIFNVATGRPVTLNVLLRTMCGILDVPFAPAYATERSGDIHHSWAAIGKAKDILKWMPKIGLEAGLRALLGK